MKKASERNSCAVLSGIRQYPLKTFGPLTSIMPTSPCGTPLPQGEVGMIEVKGPNVFKGYWRMPDKTAQEFRSDAFFITGDLGQFDDNGYLRIVGRGKDLIITG